ncbi:unnamed protein product [Boreogadus saida]
MKQFKLQVTMGAAILNSVSEFCSGTTEFNRDGEFAVRGKGACLCVSLGNVLGPPRRMDIKTQEIAMSVPEFQVQVVTYIIRVESSDEL